MPLENAKLRQEKLEKALLYIGQCEYKVVSLEELSFSVKEIQDLTLAAVTYLSLNVRDVILLLNRQDPDASTVPDSDPVKIGSSPGAEPGTERSPETQVEPGGDTGTDGQKASDGIDK